MNKKQMMRRTLVLILALVCVAAFPAVAYATDISVAADSTSVKVGDTVTVTVTVSGNDIAVADGVFTYDPAMLTYISSNGGASDGYINLVSVQKGGSDSLTAVIKFVAIGEGEVVIDVSMESVLDYDGEDLGDAQAGVSIAVASAGAAATDAADSSTPQVDLSQSGVPVQNVLGAVEDMYVWRSLRNVSLPSGFTDRQVTYNDEFVGGAAIPDSEDLLLLYLSEVSGNNAGYYIYDEEKGVFFPYRTVLSVSARYTLIWPDESIKVPSGFEQATIELGEKEMPAWTQPDSDESVYLVYVRSASGEKDFYLYNVEDRSLQRYNAIAAVAPEPKTTVQPTPMPTPEPEVEPTIAPTADTSIGLQISPVLLMALIGACVLLSAATVILAVLYKRNATQAKKQSKKGINVKNADI